MSERNFIHQFVAGSGQSARVLLILHGTGGDENSLIPLGRELDPAAALLSPRGKISENGAARFFRRLAEGVFDEEDVVRRAHELADFIVTAGDRYHFDAQNLTAVGYSNGANIASALMLLRPEVLRSAILLRAMVPLSRPPQPDLHAHRILISNGRVDPIVPLENGERLAGLFAEAGAQTRLEIQSASHALTRGDLTVAKHWLARDGGEKESG